MNELHHEASDPEKIGDGAKVQYEGATRAYEYAKESLAMAEKGAEALKERIEAFRGSINAEKNNHQNNGSPEERKSFDAMIAEKEEFLSAQESLLKDQMEIVEGLKAIIAEMDTSLLN